MLSGDSIFKEPKSKCQFLYLWNINFNVDGVAEKCPKTNLCVQGEVSAKDPLALSLSFSPTPGECNILLAKEWKQRN